MVGAWLTMKDKTEVGVGAEAAAGRRNGRTGWWKVECTGLTKGPDGPLVSPVSMAVTEATQAPALVTALSRGLSEESRGSGPRE